MISESITARHAPQFDDIRIVTEGHDAGCWYIFCQLLRPEDSVRMRPCLVAVASKAMYENDTIWGTYQTRSS